MKLDLALATHTPEGIKRVEAMNLPVVHDVRYIVSWQSHDNAPIPESLLSRDDVEIYRFDKVGQSHNRNNAIDHCSGDIILLSDDDLIYKPDAFEKIIETFKNNPDVDLATFKVDLPKPKPYPTHACDLYEKLPKGYWVGAIEIAFRRNRIGDMRCHPLLGLGSPELNGAEDEFFLLSAIRRGYKCRFFPITICSHPNPSTGTGKNLSDGYLCAAGCYIRLAYPATFLPRLLIKAYRLLRTNKISISRSLPRLFYGASKTNSILSADKCYRW